MLAIVKKVKVSMKLLHCINRHFSRQIHLDLRGAFPAIATPFDNEENIAFDKLESNVAKWQNIPFKGYVVQGSTGEVVSLTSEERIQMVQKMRQLVPRDTGKILIAGCGCESTRETTVMSSKMADAGADAMLVVTPHYYKGRLTSSAIENHFVKVADASVRPIILYSVPANTGIDLDPDSIVRLSKHSNIIGLKDSGGDISKLAYMVHKTQESEFQILAGSAGFLMPAINAGCVGGIMASSNVLGPQACELLRLLDEKKYAEAQKLQHRLVAPNWAVTKKFGIPGVKEAMEWFGYYGGPLRSPLQALNDSEKLMLKQAFQESDFI